jgi:tRNA threonylcarbamoyladenosine biosynthesis protein TsaB
MLVLALDTTTPGGSVALVRDGRVLASETGDASLTHGQRLPGDLIRLLERERVPVREVDLFAVAAGPGALTGLRIGIATMQGLALVNSRRMVGISALDALNAIVLDRNTAEPFLCAAWLDAQRGEVFSALYHGENIVDGPSVENPKTILARWMTVYGPETIAFIGDGALAYATIIHGVLSSASIATEVSPLAPVIARLAEKAAARGESVAPDAIRPIYLRRSDAELARDRRAAAQPAAKP